MTENIIRLQEDSAERQCQLSITNNQSQQTVNSFALLDSGCRFNLISINHRILNGIELKPSSKPIKLAGAFGPGKIQTRYTVEITIKFFHEKNGRHTELKDIMFHVIENPTSIHVLIGLNTMKRFGIVVGAETGKISPNGDIQQFTNTAKITITPDGKYLLDGETKNSYIVEHPFKNAVLRVTCKPTEDTKFLPYFQLPIDKHQVITDKQLLSNGRNWEVIPTQIEGMKLIQCLKLEAQIAKACSRKKEQIINEACKTIGKGLDRSVRLRLNDMLTRYHQAISEYDYDIGKTNGITCKVKTTTNTPQPCKVYDLPHVCQRIIHEEIRKLVANDILEADPEITIVTGSFLAIPKPKKKPSDKQTWRIVFDGISTNNTVEQENSSIPRIERLLTRAANHRFFTGLDLTKAFWNILIDESQRHLFTVQDPWDLQLYFWKRLAMGSNVGSHVMQRAACGLLLQNVNRKQVINYIDDFLIFGHNIDEHFEVLESILKNFVKFNFKLNAQKCNFIQEKVSVFGFEISMDGVRPSPKRVEAFKKINKPVTKKQLRKSLGAFSYYRRCVPSFAEHTAPLYESLKGESKAIIWNTQRSSAWSNIINAMQKSVLLNKADHNARFYIIADTSKYACGATLKQMDENGKLTKIIACYSYKLKENEKSWENSVKELLGVYKAVVNWEYYVYAVPFTIITDSRVVCLALKSRRNQIAHNGKLSPAFRFIQYLRNFEFEIMHQSGEHPSFILTDLLSRRNIIPRNKILTLGSKSKEPLIFIHDLLTGKMDPVIDDKRTSKVFKIDYKTMPKKHELWTEIKWAQQESRRIQDLKDRINEETVDNFKIVDNVVLTKKGLIVCPPHAIEEILNRIHFHNDSAWKLIKRFNDYELHMEKKYERIRHHIQSCDTCLRASPFGLSKYKDRTLSDLDDINQSISLDVMHFGDIKVLVSCDEFSNYASARILKSESAAHTKEAMADLLLRLGEIHQIRTDNAKNFTSEEVQHFMEAMGIHHVFSIVRNSRGNNRSEKIIHNISRELKILQPNENGEDLQSALSLALLKINTEIPRNGKYSPLEITIGRSNSIMNQVPEFTKNKLQSLDENTRKRYNHLVNIKENLMKDKRKKLKELEEDISRIRTKFKVNDLVKIINPQKGKNKKLTLPFSADTFKIKRILPYANSALLVRVSKSDRYRPRKLRCHFRQLKKVRARKTMDYQNDFKPIKSTTQESNDEEDCLTDHDLRKEGDARLGKRKVRERTKKTRSIKSQNETDTDEIHPRQEIEERLGIRRSPRSTERRNYKE